MRVRGERWKVRSESSREIEDDCGCSFPRCASLTFHFSPFTSRRGMASISRTGAELKDLRAMQAAERSRTFALCGIWRVLTLRFA